MYFGYSMWHSVKERKKTGDHGHLGAPYTDQSVAAIYKREKMAAYGEGEINGTVDHSTTISSSTRSGDRMAQAEKVIQSQAFASRQVQSVAEVHQSDVAASPQQRYVVPQLPAHHTYAEPVQPAPPYGNHAPYESGHAPYNSGHAQQSPDDARRWLDGAAAAADYDRTDSSSSRGYYGDAQQQNQYGQYNSPRHYTSSTSDTVDARQSPSASHVDDYQKQKHSSTGGYGQGQGQIQGQSAADRNPSGSIARSRPRPQSRLSTGELNLKIIGDVSQDGNRRSDQQQQQQQEDPSKNDLINW